VPALLPAAGQSREEPQGHQMFRVRAPRGHAPGPLVQEDEGHGGRRDGQNLRAFRRRQKAVGQAGPATKEEVQALPRQSWQPGAKAAPPCPV
jgi:hypothetical protein